MNDEILVMINGLPGNMATLIQRSLPPGRYAQLPLVLTGADVPNHSIPVGYYKPSKRADFIEQLKTFRTHTIIAIDYTQPTAVEDNVRFYCNNNIPFIMGTTGGNRDLLPTLVEASQISAVIAPNMSAPIVMLMDMIEYAAEKYPHTLHNWEVRITESHQAKKKDISGTALAIGKKLLSLGVNFAGAGNIRSVRDRVEQVIMGIPMTALDGHGWHKYELLSPDGKVKLGFEHNINGRDTYAEGTILALDFLASKVTAGSKGQCFSMKDVLMG